VSFAMLALICLAGVVGPVLAWPRHGYVPVVIGELAAGLALGPTALNRLHAQDKTFAFLAQIGFALIMFVVGSQVPVRDPRLMAALRTGALRAVGVGVVAAGLGLLIATVFHTGHWTLYAVLMGSSSAALILPIVESSGLSGPGVLQLLPQIAIADSVCIVALPLAIDPRHAGRAALGSLAVLAAAGVIFLLLNHVERSGARKRAHRVSESRKFALELRINLIILFTLAALATSTHVSIMLAGFSFGLVVAAIGEPRRLARQLFALTEGLFGPLFFVWLGASLDLHDLARKPSLVLLGVALGGGAVLAHVAMRATGQPLSIAALAAAQLGVPVAAVAIGSQVQVLEFGEPAAVLLGALVTMAVAAWAAATASKRDRERDLTG
jgi:Kef-type K+ transport system membrane component KefB